uniref:Uncharacterized protein n=1 Tax=Cacopsylla melanoneura TaxID=428564 RepID=A0A8D8SZM1_9HEMI
MQLLNIALGIVIVLVYVNAESTAPEKPVELSITPAKAIHPAKVRNETDIILPFVVIKYSEVTGKKILEMTIRNQERVFILPGPHYKQEKFDADATESSRPGNTWKCAGIQYLYPSQLIGYIKENEITPGFVPIIVLKEIIKKITIVNNGTCWTFA